jgi:type IV secretion system protein VirB9
MCVRDIVLGSLCGVTVGLSVAPVVVSAQTTGIREVSASDRSLIPLQTRMRYTTLVVLPQDEDIIDVICGDKDWWVISATQNIAHVKPAKEGATTNLNLVTTSGTVYSFLLTEKNGTGTPDLKVFVTSDPTASRGKPKYYTAAQFESLQTELTEARVAIEGATRRASEEIAAFKQHYPTRLTFAYAPVKYEKPFLVRAMWHDGQFTYVKSDATELPALYEMKDGTPSVVNFQVQNGTYIVPKVIERGYLALGNARLSFAQQER